MTTILPPPRHFYLSHCNGCGVESRLFVTVQPAIRAGRRHICDSKKITIFHQIFYWNNPIPVKEISLATENV